MKIYSTTCYSRFSFLDNNRIVKRSHVDKLKKSIKEIDLTKCNPIKVDVNLRIIDGQHRYQACMELGLPIYYVVLNGVDAEQAMIIDNQNKKRQKMVSSILCLCISFYQNT